MTIRVLPWAECDLGQAYDYYEAQRTGLGADFLAEFRRAADRILAHPQAWHPLDSTYRRCLLNRFPYGIIYRIDEPSQEILVLAVVHLRRHPDYWRRRLS